MNWANRVLPVFMVAVSGITPRRLPELHVAVQIGTTHHRMESGVSHGFQRSKPLFNRTLLMNTTSLSTDHPGACLVCGGTAARPRFVHNGYPVFHCPGCGLEFVAPTPSADELVEHYEHSYAVSLERYAAADKRNASRLAELERWRPERGLLLEIGAAYGHSLALARERGWEVTGVELSRAAAAYAREHFGLTVFDCDLTEARLTESSFDAVIMWHVLEHARNPKEQLLRVAALLKPGGVLGLRVPNITSFGARVTGEWWPWMCPPAHLWFFSSTTLPRLLGDCGFDVLQVRTLRGDGNNPYQYALIWAGNQMNRLRQGLRPPARAAGTSTQEGKSAISAARSKAPNPPSPRSAHSGLLERWLRVLARAQPITNAMARGTRLLIEPLERRGWGDELLVYARRLVR
jgi:SAM-dependent methyltransferase